MKNILIILLSVTFFMSCDGPSVLDQGLPTESLPAYVAFNGNGTGVVLDDISVTENSGAASFNVEAPTGSLSDITVNYEFGGSAVFGTDFTVSGASASGGSLVIKYDPTDFQQFDSQDLDITIMPDGITDGEKTLTITLVSASNDEGTLAVGRGGTDYLKTAKVIIDDVD